MTYVPAMSPYAPLPLRLFLGVFLVYMSQDNVLDATRMAEFERFLAANGFPLAELSARVSVYAQLLGGVLLLAGALTRWAAAVIAIHFVVAIVGVHLALPFRTWLEPCAMLACATALGLAGAGPFSVDAYLSGRRPM